MKPRDRKPNYSGCGPFGCPPKPEIPNWSKLQSPKKDSKKDLKKSKKGCKEGKKGKKCRQWIKRGCSFGPKGKKCRKAWLKKLADAPIPDKPRPWKVADTIQGKCKDDFRQYVKDHTGYDMVQQGTFFSKRNGLMYGSCHNPTKFAKKHCDTIKKGIKKWINRQVSFAKSKMPACAKSALEEGGVDNLFGNADKKPKKKKFQNKMLKDRRKKKPNKW